MDLFVLDIPDGENLDFQIALVDDPAIESDWIAFSKQYVKHQGFKIHSKDKRIVSGYAMIADLKIPRFDKERGAYNVIFKKENIEKIWLNFQRQNLNTNTNIMHQTGQFAEGVFVCESFIIDSDRGIKAPEGFDNEANGSWFISMKIENEEVWQQVLDGSFNGFSIEGRFTEKDTKEFTKIKMMNDKLKDKLKTFFGADTKKFESVTLVDGETVLTIEPAVEVGAAVVITNAEGEMEAAPVGEWELEDGRVIVIAEAGLVAEIIEVAADGEEVEEEVMADENQEQQKVKKIIERIESEKIFERLETAEADNKFLKEENEAFKKELVEYKEAITVMLTEAKSEYSKLEEFTKEAFTTLANEPIAEPVKPAFNPFAGDNKKENNIFLNNKN